MKIAVFAVIFFLPFYARQAESDLKEFEVELIKLVNEIRSDHYQKPLIQNAFLNASAAEKNSDMFSNGYFSHTDSKGRSFSQFVDKVGYHYGVVGENLAMGFSTPEKAAEAWKNSRTHLTNISEEQFEETGISVAVGTYRGAPMIFMTQHFAGPTLISQQEEKPFSVDTNKSIVSWEKNGGGMTMSVRVRVEGDVKSAIAYLGQHEISLQREKNEKDWTGGIVIAQSSESFFSLITPPTVSLTSSNGIRSVESLEWKNIPQSPSNVDQYLPSGFVKWISATQKLLFYSNGVYVLFLVIFCAALVGNLRKGQCEKHDKMNWHAIGMIIMLIVLIILQPAH